VSFDNFDSSDAAINAMAGQYLCGKPIEVSYAYKKDTKGERHGSAAERILAANRPTIQAASVPNQPTSVMEGSGVFSNRDSQHHPSSMPPIPGGGMFMGGPSGMPRPPSFQGRP